MIVGRATGIELGTEIVVHLQKLGLARSITSAVYVLLIGVPVLIAVASQEVGNALDVEVLRTVSVVVILGAALLVADLGGSGLTRFCTHQMYE